jgi:hypothetical protein
MAAGRSTNHPAAHDLPGAAPSLEAQAFGLLHPTRLSPARITPVGIYSRRINQLRRSNKTLRLAARTLWFLHPRARDENRREPRDALSIPYHRAGAGRVLGGKTTQDRSIFEGFRGIWSRKCLERRLR